MEPPAFEPERFRSVAEFYEQGRVAYPPALIRRVAVVCGLRPRHRLLDLGCGPGLLARAFAPLVGEVLAMDPEPAMLEAARAAADGIANIRFVQGSSYDLAAAPGPFRLVVMGRSFHWMDRPDTVRRLDRMIGRGGALACFSDRHLPLPDNDWHATWRAVRQRYEDEADTRRLRGWLRHEAVLLDSPFPRLELFAVVERRPVTVETLVRRALSMSSTSPARLGARAEAMAGDLRAALSPLAAARELTEVVRTSALVAWRP